jgi:hypothetical protein
MRIFQSLLLSLCLIAFSFAVVRQTCQFMLLAIKGTATAIAASTTSTSVNKV